MITLQLGLEILGAIAGGIYLVAKIDSTNKSNKEAIDSLAELIKQNMQDTKDLLAMNKEQQRESLRTEIAHIKDLMRISNDETRGDLKRLEEAQRASNQIKERLAIAENSLKSLHHRLDIDPPINVKYGEE